MTTPIGPAISSAIAEGREIEALIAEVEADGWRVFAAPQPSGPAEDGIVVAWAGAVVPRALPPWSPAAALLMEQSDRVAAYIRAGRPCRPRVGGVTPLQEPAVAGIAGGVASTDASPPPLVGGQGRDADGVETSATIAAVCLVAACIVTGAWLLLACIGVVEVFPR